MTRASSILALLALVLVGSVALVAARLLSRPVLDLVGKVRSVAEGHFKQRVPVRASTSWPSSPRRSTRCPTRSRSRSTG